ncbi:MAG TPA: iron-sulfur cluster co-chaperone HscB C-terminal domain-containing protein [Chitinophagaceae bacterium]|nr:iron-sulfur cluster co-chaperone HscB C-terminal domain-containing protein [Chitinophagaceae bacterium]
MNYFELFEIPVHLKVNGDLLAEKFYALSRRYHPDHAALGTLDVKDESLERSALLNKAFRTFQKPDETIKYVLQLKGLLEEEEKFELPPDFLMEVLEINEAILDSDDHSAVPGQLEKLQSEIYEPVKEIVENYKEDVTTQKELLQVKEYYYKKKYIDRIRKQLTEK